MKYQQITGILLASALLLSGCGSLNGRHNIDSGFSYIDSHEYQSALESFEAAEANSEDKCLIYRGRGIAHLHRGEYEEAISDLLVSLSADEGIVDDMDFDTNYYLAEAYLKINDYNSAKDVYDAILALHENDSTAYYLRGTAELAAGNHDAGYSDFTKAITLNSRDYSMIIMIYKALDEYGYTDEATAILQRAIDNGSDFMTNFEKGQIAYYLGNNAEALDSLKAASSERDQEKEPVIIMLGDIYEQMGEYPYAISEYKKYLSENPDSAIIYNQLGMCQIKQGDYDSAISSFELGLALDNKNFNQALEFNEITAYEYMGNFETAKSLMDSYRQKYPDDTEAEREYIFLSTR
jgi:tetratricopeptide (TPR) repeat protein